MDRYLEAGVIVNTHGVHGEVKIQPWADSPGFLAGFEYLYIDGARVKVLSARVHKGFVLALLDGVSDIGMAIAYKGKTVFIDREDALLEDGRFFIADVIGARAVDAATGEGIGVVTEVISLPANDVYVISGEREVLVPAVPDFVEEVNLSDRFIRIRMREGM